MVPSRRANKLVDSELRIRDRNRTHHSRPVATDKLKLDSNSIVLFDC